MERQFLLVTPSSFHGNCASCEASKKMHNLNEPKKWRPFHATDFDSLMYPCFFICGMFGAFPYKRTYAGYSFSKARFVYTMLMMVLFLSLLLLLEYEINYDLLSLTTIPKVMNLHFYVTVCGSIILIMYIQSGTKLPLIQDLSDLSSMLESKDFDDLAKLIHSKDIGIFLFLASHALNCVKIDVYMTVKNFITLFMTLFIFAMDMLYINCVCVLKACFTRLNEDLNQLKKPTVQEFLRHGQRSSSLLMKLKNFQEKHLRIIDVQHLLNKMFLLQIVVVTVTTFTVVTFELYFYILWRTGGDRKENYQFWYMRYITSAIYHFVKYAMIIWSCETATNRARQIRTTMHSILNQVTDSSVRREVELFSLQLLHDDNTFSVRMFRVNASLLTQMVGGIAMYILILIQFLLNTVMCMFLEG